MVQQVQPGRPRGALDVIRDDTMTESEILSTLILRGVSTQEGYWMRGGMVSWIDRLIPNGQSVPLPSDESTVEIPIWNLEDPHVTASTYLLSRQPDSDGQARARVPPGGA